MGQSKHRLLTAFVVIAFVASGLSALAVGGAPAAPAGRSPILHSPFFGTTTSTSHNWAGYAIKTKNGAVTDVKGSWNVPQIAAACPSAARYSAFWVGIDGDGSSTVEQTGTATYCSGGSPVYFAWYEMYPGPYHTLSMTISPTDVMHAEVKYSTTTHKFTLSMRDSSTGHSFSTIQSLSGAKRSSAEWIAEAPTGGSGVLPLTNFGWVTFNNASATISGHTHSISGFSNIEITMWNLANTKKMAVPNSLSNAGKTFKVTWKNSGP
ncbi:MAG: G1 family endopeptidase [Thermoplasmata archaeon]|nr:G1 family endopeptidase [Thermoplasmata archaeon]